jgi:hypothetical protein
MASGDTLLIFDALAAREPSANMATLDFRNQIPVRDFDDTTSESLFFVAVLPRHYGGGGITATVTWTASTATSGAAVWETAFERGNTDLDADSFATGNNAAGTANGTSGIVTQTSIAHTNGAQIDSAAVGDLIRVRLARLPANGSDTMVGDAEFIVLELRET